MQDILDRIKVASARALSRRVKDALFAAHDQLKAQTSSDVGSRLPAIDEQAPATVERFKQSLYEYFDQLSKGSGAASGLSPEMTDSISLLDHDYIEAMIAMEGMVKKMHEREILGEAEFLDRLAPLFPGIQISQKNNPLDPEQVGDCFNQAIRPLGLKAHFLLTIYREFNKNVFEKFEDILSEINRLLAASEELPGSVSAIDQESIDAKSKSTEPFADLSALLDEHQANDTLPSLPLSLEAEKIATERDDGVYLTLQRALAQVESDNTVSARELYEQNNAQVQSIVDTGLSGTSSGLDRQSFDCLTLVSLFYQCLLEDKTLSDVVRKLLVQTQIPISRAVLADIDFFNCDAHPGRVFLDEIARLGIAWADSDSFASNPDYIKTSTLVNRLESIEATDRSNLQSLVDEMLEYSRREEKIEEAFADRLKRSDNPGEIQSEAEGFVEQQLADRILEQNLDPAIRKLLNTHLHNALVKILGNDGLGSKSWKAVMQTIDVMLWSVKQEKQPGDAQRFAKIKDRLMTNIEQTMEFSSASKTKTRRALRQLKQVQEYTFLKAETDRTLSTAASPIAISVYEPASPPSGDPALMVIDEASVGSWFQFPGTDGQPRRLRLVARIDAIEKFIFREVNSNSTVELSRNRLANAVKSGDVLSLGGGPGGQSLTHRAIGQLYSRLSLSR